MLINNNYNRQSFGCIKIEKGGIELLKKEGAEALTKAEQATGYLSTFKWHLNIHEDSYSLTSPTTKKTYNGPFTIKRHVKKNKNKADEYRIIVRMGNNNAEKYTINYDSMQEVQNIYKEVKNSKGIDKMIKLLQILEKGFNLKHLRHRVAKINKLSEAQIIE